MNTQRENDRLDKLIYRTINTEKPQFDTEKWKQKYPSEYQMLVSRREKAASSRRPNILKVVFGKQVAQLATAASVIVVVGLLLSRDLHKLDGPAANSELITKSPAKIITMASMRMAYQRGGFDALDKQFRDTLEVFGPRSSSVSIQELL